ncbi:MAG: phosphonate ABC transporter ATP-binding protein [Clostridia bacterium]|nr:phosphonate ABC transporter ATP-binding protein [Clostridia bacterium]
MECLLKFKNVVKSYGSDSIALDNVSLEINEGEFVSVIGPSGSGKTTFLRSINKLIPVTKGEIYFNGENISDKKGKALRMCRRKIGMVFQNYNLVYRLSVIQNVLHGRLGYMSGLKGILGRYSEEDKKMAVDILGELGLQEYIYNRAADLSGGQKQRVGIARAIMQNPRLLLCDEPIASLDPSSAKVIMDRLYQMTKRRNIACIVNLHQVDVAKKYSTRIIGLSKGNIVFDGKPEELTDSMIEKIYGTSLDNLMLGGNEGA